MNNIDKVQKDNEEIEINLGELFHVLLAKAWLIILAAVIIGGAGFCISYFVITEQYESTTEVYILSKQDGTAITYSDVQLGTQLTSDYAELVTCRAVLEKVMDNYELDTKYKDFKEQVKVTTLNDTRILAITVTDPDPKLAQELANAIREVAAEHIKNVMDIEAVNVVEEANLPEEPASPSVPKWTIIGFTIGFLLMGAIVVIRELLDDTLKTGDDIEKYLQLSTLAMIPTAENDKTTGKGRKHKAEIHKYEKTERPLSRLMDLPAAQRTEQNSTQEELEEEISL